MIPGTLLALFSLAGNDPWQIGDRAGEEVAGTSTWTSQATAERCAPNVAAMDTASSTTETGVGSG